ncbi:MAG: YtxH domain-containing protein [Anaerolineae bacterium]|nr:YtxH domain-containing protein [Anaerolineae bacterium]
MSTHEEDGMNYCDCEGSANLWWGLLVGLLAGGLVGAAAMLLFAPQSGKKTRATIQKKGLSLRDQATKTVKGASTQLRSKAHQLTHDVQVQAEDLQQRGQDAIDEQRDNLGQGLKDLGKTIHT